MDLRICLLPLLVLLLSPCLASEAHGNDDLSFEYAEDIVAKTEGPPSKIAERFMKEHEKCAQNDWACQPHCNRKFVRPTERHCRIPHRDDNCFGIPIRYNYTFAEGGIDRFPAEYEVLKRFPRCWSSLAPLICAAVYRPCSVRSYYMAGFDEISSVEVWEVLRRDSCLKAREECANVVDLGFWPSFLDCDDTVHSNGTVSGPRGLFDTEGECKTLYNEAPSRVAQEQCVWPLVNSSSPDFSPVVDGCHMPCKTPLASQEGLVLFTIITLLLAGLLSALLFFAASWLFLVAQTYVESYCVFALKNICFSGFVYFFALFWAAFPGLSEVTQCSDGGRLRSEPGRHHISFCVLQAFSMHSAILAGVFWASFFVVLVTLRHGRHRWSRLADDTDLRTPAYIFFYGMATLCAFVSVMANTIDVDGATNICYVGIRNFLEAPLLHGPILVAILCAGAFALYGALLNCKKEDFGDDTDETLLPSVHRDLARVEDRARRLDPFEMPYQYIGILVCGLCLTFVGGLFSHIFMSVAADLEHKEIFKSIECSLNETFSNFDAKWALHPSYLSPETDPFARRSAMFGRVASSPKCNLGGSELYTQHILGSFGVLVFFPLFPFLMALYIFRLGYRGEFQVTDLKQYRQGSTLGPWWDRLSCCSKPGYSKGKSSEKIALSEVKNRVEEVEEGLLVQGNAAPTETKRMLVEMSDGELPSASVSRPFGSTEQLNHSARTREVIESGFETEPVASSGDCKVKIKNDETHERFRVEMEKQKRMADSSSDGEGALTSVSQRPPQEWNPDLTQNVEGDRQLYNRLQLEAVCNDRFVKFLHRILTSGPNTDEEKQIAEQLTPHFHAVVNATLPTLYQQWLANFNALAQQNQQQAQQAVEEGEIPKESEGEDDEVGSQEEGSLEPISEEEDEEDGVLVEEPPQDPLVVMSAEDFVIESQVDGEDARLNPFALARFLARNEDLLGSPVNLRVLRHFQPYQEGQEDGNLVRSLSGYLFEFRAEQVPFYFPDGHAYFSPLTEDDLLDRLESLIEGRHDTLAVLQTPEERYRYCFEMLHSDGCIYRYDMSAPGNIVKVDYAQMLLSESARLFGSTARQMDLFNAVAPRERPSPENVDDPDHPTCSRYVIPEARPAQEAVERAPTNGSWGFQNLDSGSSFGSVDLNESLPDVLAPEQNQNRQGQEEVPRPPTFYHQLEERPDRLFDDPNLLDENNYHERLQEFLRTYQQVQQQIPSLEEMFRQNPHWDASQREQYAQLYDPENMFRAAVQAEGLVEGPVEEFNRRENIRIGMELAGVRNRQDIREQFAEAIRNELQNREDPEGEAAAEREDNEGEEEEESAEEEDTSADEGVASESSEEQPPSPPHP